MRKIKTGDDVIVIAGKDKGKMGKVIRFKGDDYVMVENINLVKRHTRPNPRTNAAGGIIDKEMPLHVSNVAIYNRTTDKADKVGFTLNRMAKISNQLNGEQIVLTLCF